MATMTIAANLKDLLEITSNSYNARAYPMTVENTHRLHKVLDMAKARRISVKENIDPDYGGYITRGVHSLDGMHYALFKCPKCNRYHSGAADLNYGVSGATEQSMLDPIVAIAIINNVRALYGRDVAGHAHHAHFDTTPVDRSQVTFYNPKDLAWPGNDYPVYFTETLRAGSTGSRVRFLQQMLVALGHPLKTDGSFGPATRAAVKAFQRANGLSVDGVAGPKTLTRVLVEYCYWKIGK